MARYGWIWLDIARYSSICWGSPGAPRGSPGAPRAPEAPRNSQRLPRSSQRLPRSSQRFPGVPPYLVPGHPELHPWCALGDNLLSLSTFFFWPFPWIPPSRNIVRNIMYFNDFYISNLAKQPPKMDTNRNICSCFFPHVFYEFLILAGDSLQKWQGHEVENRHRKWREGRELRLGLEGLGGFARPEGGYLPGIPFRPSWKSRASV